MKKRSRFYSSLKKRIEEIDIFSPEKAISFLKENAKNKDSLSYRLNLSLDNNKKESFIKKNLLLPNISSNNNKIAILKDNLDNDTIKLISSNDKVKLLTLSEVIPLLKRKKTKKVFSKLIAHKSSKEHIDKFKSVLSKKKMYPNEKNNTLVSDLIKEIDFFDERATYFSYDKDGNISLKFGNYEMDNDDLLSNYKSAIDFFNLNKPIGFKGRFIKKISISTTNSPGINIPII